MNNSMEKALTAEEIRTFRKNQYTHLVVGSLLILLPSGWYFLGYYHRQLELLVFGALILGAIVVSRSLIKIFALRAYLRGLRDRNPDVLDG